MARKIVITSGKGGVGKTTVTANLGAALARIEDVKVVLLDVDLGLNNLDVLMGVENKIVYDIVDVIENRCRVRQALIQDRQNPNLFVLPSAHSYDKSNVTGQNIKYVVDSLAETFDYVILDCPAGIEVGFHRAVAAAEEALIVTTPHISAIRDADKVLSILKGYEITDIGLIVNRARGDLILSFDMMDVEDISGLLKIKAVGVIPDEDDIAAFSGMGKPINNISVARKAFDILAKSVHTKTEELYDCTLKYRGVFGKLKRNLRKMV